MNETSFPQNHVLIRTVLVLTICALLYGMPVQVAQADGAPPPQPSMGGVAPYQPIETSVQMLSETVLIDVRPHPTRWTPVDQSPLDSNQINVRASFTLRNQGTTEEKMQVIFPLSPLTSPSWAGASYNIIDSSFVALVDGKPVPTTTVYTPPELLATPDSSSISSELPEGFFPPDVAWAGFDVVFPVHQDVIVQVEYDMQGDTMAGVHHVDYILETGAGWYGRILSADIIVRLPYPASSESVPTVAPGCSFSGNEVQCRRKNFEPKREDNLTFGFIDTNYWPPILELRSRVRQYPEDADAWYKLGEKYEMLGFWRMEGMTAVANQHLVDAAMDAFEKAVDLRHDWGDAHVALARVLWFGRKHELTAGDPVLQRVLLEMQLAASHGISQDNYRYEYVSGDILAHLPNLERSLLPVPIKLTPIPALPFVSSVRTSTAMQKVTAMAMGHYHTCVLTIGGEVTCEGWKVNRFVVEDAAAVVAGDFYTCILTPEGAVKCMGQNDFGQLGNGTTDYSSAPVDVVGLTRGVSALVAGDNHTCALLTSGGVKCWGRNYFGELGDGTTAYSLVPVDVDGLATGVASLVASSDQTCAFMQAGGIKCWGANESAQLGDGSLQNPLKPADLMGLPKDVTALAVGFSHTCALTSQGQVICWGDNSYGQLGDGNTVIHAKPVVVPGLDGVVKLAAGNGFTCALTREGGVKCWGRNDPYIHQLGDSTTIDRFTPGEVDGLASGAVDVAAANDHTCALLQNGSLKCWGITYGYPASEAELSTRSAPASSELLPTYTAAPLPTLPTDLYLSAVPPTIPEAPIDTPAPLPTPIPTAPTELSSPTPGLAWGLILSIVICVLILLWQRSKAGDGK